MPGASGGLTAASGAAKPAPRGATWRARLGHQGAPSQAPARPVAAWFRSRSRGPMAAIGAARSRSFAPSLVVVDFDVRHRATVAGCSALVGIEFGWRRAVSVAGESLTVAINALELLAGCETSEP